MFATGNRRLSLKAGVVFLAALGVAVFAISEMKVRLVDGRPSLPPVECEHLAPHYSLETVGELPEQVVSLVCERGGPNSYLLFAGTRGNGGVFRVSPRPPFGMAPLLPATGDQPEFGTAAVSSLVLTDFDRDGKEELIALTAQETPRGKSRAYIIGTRVGAGLGRQEMTTAEIASSWPHGVALVKDVFGRPTFLSAYCGHGEVVEFRLFDRKTAAGFHSRGLESRHLGTLAASGEQIASSNLFGDGVYVLAARGFKFNAAAVEIFARDRSTPFQKAAPGALGLGWTRKWELREDDRFGNVRFLVGRSRNGLRDLFAWWCVGLADGPTEFVHYRLGPEGVVERQSLDLGPAHDCWPEENRIALVDGDGSEELYFVGRAGKLWRLDLAATSGDPEVSKLTPPTLIASFPGGGGPIAVSPIQKGGVGPLYVGVGNHVVKVTPPKGKTTPAAVPDWDSDLGTP